ncbi:MAG: DUF502 domain-containing protein [Phycisphaerae bacterium]|nr:DUF502 domain-containing protein [Phycisphaerae bacterium]
MANKAEKSFANDFRKFFLKGLATLLPTVLTIILLIKGYEFIQENISVHITEGVIKLVVNSTDSYPVVDPEELPEFYRSNPDISIEQKSSMTPEEALRSKAVRSWKMSEQWNQWPRSLVGFVLAVLLVYIVGRVLASFLGRRLWQMFEHGVARVPGFKQVYPHIKQVTEFFFGENKVQFNRVVAVQYPRAGLWSIGLVTGSGMNYINETQKEQYLTIFVPSSPTPVTGYIIHAKRDEVLDLPMTIDEAFRFTISGGVIVPEHQLVPGSHKEFPAVAELIRKQEIKNETETKNED